MKKVLTLFSLVVMTVTMMSAQPKNAADAQKAIDKAVANSLDAKKSLKAKTWIDLADVYLAAYNGPAANIMINTSQMEMKLLLKDQKIISSESVKTSEGMFTVDHYENKDLYYNEAGVLVFYKVTVPFAEGDLLGMAHDALLKAAELDPKKAKDVAEKIEAVHSRYNAEAMAEYYLENYAAAGELFGKAAASVENNVSNGLDTLSVYYSAIMAGMAGNNDYAIGQYKKCIDHEYYVDGNVFSNLANIYKAAGDTATCKATLEDGFARYPKSQGVLVGLINLYTETKDDPSRLFDIIHVAQANEPQNASLYNVEASVYKEIGDFDNAIKLFVKTNEVDPKYFFGYYSLGGLYYDMAVKYSEEASLEYDDAKYNALMEKANNALESAIAPFEKGFDCTEDVSFKKAAAEYLKTIFFRFREKSEEYSAKYEKYNNYLSEN